MWALFDMWRMRLPFALATALVLVSALYCARRDVGFTCQYQFSRSHVDQLSP
jgi:hypothetical protein